MIGDRERHIETKNGPKEGISACLAVTASGHKLDTMFIKAGKTTRCLKKIEPHPHAMWTYSAKGWSTEATMLVWFEKVLLPYTRGRPAVVVMDDYDAHWVESVRDYASAHNIHLIKVPAGETPHSQPLDCTVMGPLKSAAKRAWRTEVIKNPEKKLTLGDGVKLFLRSYHLITASTIIKGFNQSFDRACAHVQPSPEGEL